MSAAPAERHPVERIAEEFLERYRRGERPELHEYTGAYPELAEQILGLFPALVLLEGAAAVPAGGAPVPSQLGAYRILREVGRGGMGIVYEAVHESLGRHVALKVLAGPRSSDAQWLERFRREARSAAGLHHTNIVPVFEVNEHQGTQYYAMQFIHGGPLDRVLATVRERRAPDAPEVGPAWLIAGGAEYYRRIARIGVQVADALAYAHGQGVVHRDIKPANLLVDEQGTAWVTDFGLAKQVGDELTRTGDVVGTLRYLAPERFSGVSDARGDIYSLGLTLYECLTLRPAFEDADRARLIHQVTNAVPVPPSRFDRRVPHDLETIVLKAIAREPERRYQHAAELAEDLRRFLADQPIQARRLSWAEHAWRWVRRNPGWAAMLAVVAGLLLVIAVGGVVMNLRLQQAFTELQAAEQVKTEKLWESYLDRARARRVSGQVGQRFQALAALGAAAEIRVTRELQDEASAALVLPDVEVAREWEAWSDDTLELAFDGDYERYARLNRQGEVAVCEWTAAGEAVIARLPAHGVPPFGATISRDGRVVVVRHAVNGAEAAARRLRVWKIDPEPAVVLDVPVSAYRYALAVSPDSRWAAAATTDGAVQVFDLATGRLVHHLTPGRAPEIFLAFHPRDASLAIAAEGVVRVIDLDTGATRSVMRHDVSVHAVAWHPDGRRLATGCGRRIHHWDTATGRPTMPPWAGHTAEGIILQFHPTGDRLLSTDWEAVPRVWDANGRLLLRLPAGVWNFSGDGRWVGWDHVGTKVRLYRLAAGRELRVLRSPQGDDAEQIHQPRVHAGNRLLATCAHHRLSIFDLATGEECASVRLERTLGARPIGFDRRGDLVTGGHCGLLRWAATSDPDKPHVVNFGPPRADWPAATGTYSDGARANRDGSVLAVPQDTHTLVFHRNRPGEPIVLGPQYNVRSCAVSPDGRWVVGCGHWWDGKSQNVRIWDAHRGVHVRDLPAEESSAADFSPDGRWLVTNTTGANCRVWEVGTWREHRRSKNANFAISPDGRMLALEEDLIGVIRLVETDSGHEITRLTGPEPIWYSPVAFTPDGTCLITTCTGLKAIYVWDLALIRRGLAELRLDWDWPAFPEPMAGSAAPLEVHIDAGKFAATAP